MPFAGEIAAAVTEDPTLLAGWFTALIAAAAVVTLLLRWGTIHRRLRYPAGGRGDAGSSQSDLVEGTSR